MPGEQDGMTGGRDAGYYSGVDLVLEKTRQTSAMVGVLFLVCSLVSWSRSKLSLVGRRWRVPGIFTRPVADSRGQVASAQLQSSRQLWITEPRGGASLDLNHHPPPLTTLPSAHTPTI